MSLVLGPNEYRDENISDTGVMVSMRRQLQGTLEVVAHTILGTSQSGLRMTASKVVGRPVKHPGVAPLARVPCGARRHRDGQPCVAWSVAGKRRCRWHGGASTGPRTPEGIAKVIRNLPNRASKS
jgi:hypothetical protein